MSIWLRLVSGQACSVNRVGAGKGRRVETGDNDGGRQWREGETRGVNGVGDEHMQRHQGTEELTTKI
ncbi:hypothetical protein TIFTF001_023911 [Ficus carica]|uniref:Uncharacterized protein n=1 Tax=Ficus carica TaxID=3494 RepID=A0AA88AXD9_FICCA|nr:hypothetical protein TIFTF001_023911 [Ficus carica]